jgi:uncharacterized membrane protein YcjF (UPF0283 family)
MADDIGKCASRLALALYNQVMLAAISVIAGLVIILTGVVSFVMWLRGVARRRKAFRVERQAAEEAEAKRIDQRRRIAKKNHATAVLLQTTRSQRAALPFDDPWSQTSATGYAASYRDDLRRRLVTPAEHARGQR